MGLSLTSGGSSPSLVDGVENSVMRRARGFVLFSSSMADTLAPPLEDLLPFFCSRAMKFSLRELDLWLLPSVRFLRSAPLLLLQCFTGDTRFCRLLKESEGSLRPRTFRLDLKGEHSFNNSGATSWSKLIRRYSSVQMSGSLPGESSAGAPTSLVGDKNPTSCS